MLKKLTPGRKFDKNVRKTNFGWFVEIKSEFGIRVECKSSWRHHEEIRIQTTIDKEETCSESSKYTDFSKRSSNSFFRDKQSEKYCCQKIWRFFFLIILLNQFYYKFISLSLTHTHTHALKHKITPSQINKTLNSLYNSTKMKTITRNELRLRYVNLNYFQ